MTPEISVNLCDSWAVSNPWKKILQPLEHPRNLQLKFSNVWKASCFSRLFASVRGLEC